MVEQNRSGAYTQIVYSPTAFKMQILNGQSVTKNFVPLAGGATAVWTGPTLTAVRHPDWLGSSRFASTPSRTMYSDAAYAPFGEPYAQSGTADLSFTGQNSDTVSNDYDFLYRPYSIQGRWPTPDPAGLASVAPSNPQSWNRYAYVLNEPLILVDPVGTCPEGYRPLSPDERSALVNAADPKNWTGWTFGGWPGRKMGGSLWVAHSRFPEGGSWGSLSFSYSGTTSIPISPGSPFV